MIRHRRRRSRGRAALLLPWLALAVVPVLADPAVIMHRAPVRPDVVNAELDDTAERTAHACAGGWAGCQNFR